MATDSPAATHIHWAAGASPFRPQEERQAMTKTREREREREIEALWSVKLRSHASTARRALRTRRKFRGGLAGPAADQSPAVRGSKIGGIKKWE